ncbi:MAG TPA: 4-hydroxy-3-methylbut-2-enyl diphosphate reductase [Burkholderiaceae bacterium]|nr:4-hydroxy-3-methylbut-2-enyl diphosphate reductase [Burkholderiaceae bacterium]
MGSFRRTSFGLKLAVRPEIEKVFASRLVEHIRENDFGVDLGTLQLRLPRSFGLCHGVERAIQLAHETRLQWPQARLFLTDEIVHNPSVNRRLQSIGYRYLGGRYADGTTIEQLCPDDVVVLPAFGIETTLLERLRDRGVQLIDTTCGEVMTVWKRVRAYARDGYTTVIHGAPSHQETRATVSRVDHDDPFLSEPLHAGGAWIVLRDVADARLIARFVVGRAEAGELRARFDGALSPGFDAARDLQRIGIANQTTMLARETLQLQEILWSAFVERYGQLEASARVRRADTVCSATQDRQDALRDLLGESLDLLLVVGGYNSANTSHLVELARAQGVPAFHLEGAHCIVSRDMLRQWNPEAQRELSASDWWPERVPCRIGLAAGASTPDVRIGEIVLRIAELANVEIPLDFDRQRDVAVH